MHLCEPFPTNGTHGIAFSHREYDFASTCVSRIQINALKRRVTALVVSKMFKGVNKYSSILRTVRCVHGHAGRGNS